MSETFVTEVPTSITPPAAPAPAGGAATPGFIDSLPTEYRETTWAKDFAKNENPLHAFAKSYESQQSMIGKNSGGLQVPGDDATPEVRQAFNKALGVPDTVDGYEYKLPDLSKEAEPLQKYMQASRDESFTKAMQAAAHEAGMTPKQFSKMAEALDGFSLSQAKTIFEAKTQEGQQRAETQAKLVKEIYGDQHETVHRIAKDTLAKVLPEAVRNTKDPEIVMLELAKYIHENMFKGDSISKPGAAPAETVADLEQQKWALRNSEAFKKGWQHPEYQETNDKLQAIYKRIAEMKAGAKD